MKHTTIKSSIDSYNDFLLPIIFAINKTTIFSSTNLHVYAINVYIQIDHNYYYTSQWNAMSTELKSSH